MPKRLLVPVPDTDFDTTEVAVPWKLFRRAGHEVVFATERGGSKPACDPLLISGVLFGQLGAEPEPKAFYRELEQAAEFAAPRPWSELRVEDFDALLLPGGHAPGMRQYLGHEGLHRFIHAFFASGKPVGAICHGALAAARARGPDGKSALYGRRTTCLPGYMERTAWFLTAWKLGRYYRTYDAYVEEEVRAALERPEHFVRGPTHLMKRGTDTDDSPAFVVEDGAYVSARWPGDAYKFGKALLAKL
jgi:putative intracellular protease/amidase